MTTRWPTSAIVPATSLVPGDEIDGFFPGGHDLTILNEREDLTDVNGRPMFRYWCERDDNGEEGWLIFGPISSSTRKWPRVSLIL